MLDKRIIVLMNLMLNVYIRALGKRSAPLLPEWIVKCTHLAPSQNYRGRQLCKINSTVIAKVRILVEQVMLQGI